MIRRFRTLEPHAAAAQHRLSMTTKRTQHKPYLYWLKPSRPPQSYPPQLSHSAALLSCNRKNNHPKKITPYDVGCRRGSFIIARMKAKITDSTTRFHPPKHNRCGSLSSRARSIAGPRPSMPSPMVVLWLTLTGTYRQESALYFICTSGMRLNSTKFDFILARAPGITVSNAI